MTHRDGVTRRHASARVRVQVELHGLDACARHTDTGSGTPKKTRTTPCYRAARIQRWRWWQRRQRQGHQSPPMDRWSDGHTHTGTLPRHTAMPADTRSRPQHQNQVQAAPSAGFSEICMGRDPGRHMHSRARISRKTHRQICKNPASLTPVPALPLSSPRPGL